METAQFRYHPKAYENGTFKQSKTSEPEICECCGKETDWYYDGIYSEDEVEVLCPECISSGAAAKEYNGQFIQDAEEVLDEEKKDELFNRTPGYESWQGEFWLVHCGDYCTFIDRVGIKELEEMGIAKEALYDYSENSHYFDYYPVEAVKAHLSREGGMTGYLFRCLHCGKYRLGVDAN